ncbi:DUF6074 family protein [Aminobacter sp. BE322]|uniref:DUF6074 family protein n=1 Tax=unclassified Aminobacter TaxID=2644704 RepID=UPI003D19B6E5
MRQLDLFDWKPSAKIVMFPLASRRALVRQAVTRMASMTDSDVLQYWETLAREIAGPLLAAGVPREAVRLQVGHLFDKIVMETFWGSDEDEPRGGIA